MTKKLSKESRQFLAKKKKEGGGWLSKWLFKFLKP